VSRIIKNEVWVSGVALDDWRVRQNSQVSYETSISGWIYLWFGAEPSANRATLKLSPFDSDPSTGPGETFDNLLISMDLLLPASHPLVNGSTTENGNNVLTLNTLDPDDNAEINFDNRDATKLDVSWKPNDPGGLLDFRTGGWLNSASVYGNSHHYVNAEDVMSPGVWTHIQIKARLNPDQASGQGSLLEVTRIRPTQATVLSVADERWNRTGKGIRIFQLGWMEDNVGNPPESNGIGFGPFLIENLDYAKAHIGGVAPSGYYLGEPGSEMLFDASRTISPEDESGSIPITSLDFNWDFGDNSVISGQGLYNPTHTYAETGVFYPTVTVTRNSLSDTATGVAEIVFDVPVVTDPLYSGVIVVDANGPYTGLTSGNLSGPYVLLSAATSSADISLAEVTWYWDFNNDGVWDIDGILGIYEPSGFYVETGTYTVVASGVHPSGASSFDTSTVVIRQASQSQDTNLVRFITPSNLGNGIESLIENTPANVYIYGDFGIHEDIVSQLQINNFTVYRRMNIFSVPPWGAYLPDSTWENFMWNFCESKNLWLRDDEGEVITSSTLLNARYPNQYHRIIDWGKINSNKIMHIAIGPTKLDGSGFIDVHPGPLYLQGAWNSISASDFTSGVVNGGHLTLDNVDYNPAGYGSGIVEFINTVASGTNPLFASRTIALQGNWNTSTGWDYGISGYIFPNVFSEADQGIRSQYLAQSIDRWQVASGSMLEIQGDLRFSNSISSHVRLAVSGWIVDGGNLLTNSDDVGEYAIGIRDDNLVANAGAYINGYIFSAMNMLASGTLVPSGISGRELLYQWDFGDNSPITQGIGLSGVSHKYSASGVYLPEVTISYGALSDTDTTRATVLERIVANMGVNVSGNVGESLYFDGSAA